jgi:hypothetical protein
VLSRLPPRSTALAGERAAAQKAPQTNLNTPSSAFANNYSL